MRSTETLYCYLGASKDALFELTNADPSSPQPQSVFFYPLSQHRCKPNRAVYLEEIEEEVSFLELMKGLVMPVVVVWIGVLLGGYWVEQRGGFYTQEI